VPVIASSFSRVIVFVASDWFTIQPIRSNRKFNARYFPISSVARNYHGWKYVADCPKFSASRKSFREIDRFGESRTVSTNHISSWLKSIWFGFYEFLELDRMTNVSSLTACESSSWVIIHMTSSLYDSSWLMTHVSQYWDLRVSWSANHISPEICFIWPLIGQNFNLIDSDWLNSKWPIPIGQNWFTWWLYYCIS